MTNNNIDESELNWIDRLGLACCRINTFEWDDIFGEKPAGFDELPDGDPKRGLPFHKPVLCKMDFLSPLIGLVKDIGVANASRCWWIFELGRTEEEWLNWYLSREVDRIKKKAEATGMFSPQRRQGTRKGDAC